jgi:methionyl-tRNA formyltransferase
MTDLNVIFMGSENFSLPILRSLTGDEAQVGARVVGIVTQPDRAGGRGRKVVGNPVKAYALEHDVPVLQPERLRDALSVSDVLDFNPGLIVVASYGQIVPRTILDAPILGSLNLHPSLLPLYRGASPITAPILAGDRETGATLMLMRPKMDAGPILAQEIVSIDPAETSAELEARLAEISARLLSHNLREWVNGEIQPIEQDERFATYTTRLEKSDGRIDWNRPANLIARQVRAFNPWPAAYTYWSGRLLKILRAHASPGWNYPGQVRTGEFEPFTVGTGDGLLSVEELQLAGGRPMAPADVLRGHPTLSAATLGGIN